MTSKDSSLKIHKVRLRELAVEKLLQGINDTHNQAASIETKVTDSDYKSRSWHKQNYYRVMGYLVQVLNSVLTKADLDAIRADVAESRRRILELERSRPPPG